MGEAVERLCCPTLLAIHWGRAFKTDASQADADNVTRPSHLAPVSTQPRPDRLLLTFRIGRLSNAPIRDEMAQSRELDLPCCARRALIGYKPLTTTGFNDSHRASSYATLHDFSVGELHGLGHPVMWGLASHTGMVWSALCNP